MKEVTVIVDGVTTVFEVPSTVSTADVIKAILTTGLEHVGGRPKR